MTSLKLTAGVITTLIVGLASEGSGARGVPGGPLPSVGMQPHGTAIQAGQNGGAVRVQPSGMMLAQRSARHGAGMAMRGNPSAAGFSGPQGGFSGSPGGFNGQHHGHPNGGSHHHHHNGSTVFIGTGFYWPFYGYSYGYPYAYPYTYQYAYPPVVAGPDAYVEQGQQGGDWWYFCESAQLYYPYVRECPEGWQRVAPH